MEGVKKDETFLSRKGKFYCRTKYECGPSVDTVGAEDDLNLDAEFLARVGRAAGVNFLIENMNVNARR